MYLLKKMIIRYGFMCALSMGMILISAQGLAVEQKLESSEITQAIETELLLDPMVYSNKIDVETKDGIVTLSGRVHNILAKERAIHITEAVKGVRSVINKLAVSPIVGKKAEDIQKEIVKKLLLDPATESFEIDVKVKKPGVVTLKGAVESYAEKELCENVAKEVGGVTSLDNQITVDYAEKRSDYEIEQEINQRLKYNIWVDSDLIDVNVRNGRVSLSGTVGSAAEKRYARVDAWTHGVKSVNADDLEIKWWAKDKMKKEHKYSDLDDNEIRDAIQDALLYDPRVYSFNPEVDVENGVVTLKGAVNNLKAKRAAEMDAKNTRGVWRVKNYLKVRPDMVFTDPTVANSIETALTVDPFVEAYELDVMVINGVVYLNGSVENKFEKNRAEDLASKQPGVISIDNDILIDDSWTFKSDEEIKEDIEDEFFWSLRVNDDINIQVDYGIVTLSGTVDTPYEAEAAVRNAFEGGAESVINNLAVEQGRSSKGVYEYNQYHSGYPFYPISPYRMW